MYEIRNELKSGDLFIQYGERYDDCREQLVDDEVFGREMMQYRLVTGVETDPKGLPGSFCQRFRQQPKLSMLNFLCGDRKRPISFEKISCQETATWDYPN